MAVTSLTSEDTLTVISEDVIERYFMSPVEAATLHGSGLSQSRNDPWDLVYSKTDL